MARTTIAIVGAGVAGLAVARALRERGREVIILEARRRIGGRVHTLHPRSLPLPVELGAEFVHGEARRTRQLLAEAGLATVDIDGESVELRNGQVRRAPFWRGIDRVLGRVDLRRADMSFADYLERRRRVPAAERRAAHSFVQGFHAADPERASLRAIAPGRGESVREAVRRSARVLGGYDGLVKFLADGLQPELRLGHAVTRMRWRKGEVEVTVVAGAGESASVRFRAAVVTVPLGVLQARSGQGAIALEPEPPGMRGALDGLEMGAATRVTLALESFPWQRDERRVRRLRGAAYLHTPGRPFSLWLASYPAEWPVLVAWSGGPPAAELSARLGRRELVELAIGELARASGTRRDRLEVRHAWCHDWNRDRLARGAYSYALVGGSEAAKALSRPIGGTLFFAGEATDTEGNTGTVEGALASAERVVEQVERSLGD